MKFLLHFIMCAVFLVASSGGVAGENKEEAQSITGKVIHYQPNEKIVVDLGSNQKQAFKVTSDTALKDKGGNRSNYLDLQPGTTVRIKVKDDTAASIRTVADIAGPDFNPTPKPGMNAVQPQ
jgi:hypothetical protein